MIIDENVHNNFREKVNKVLRIQPDLCSKKSIIILIKQLLNEQTSPSWYLINDDLLEQLGIPAHNRIYISGPEYFRPINVKGFELIFFAQKWSLSHDVIPFLQLLDVLVIFRTLSTVQFRGASYKYLEIVRHLSCEEKKRLTKLARKYPPSIRAVFASLLCIAGDTKHYIKLAETINPIIFKKHKEKLILKVLAE